MKEGYLEGERCNRHGCNGIIDAHEKEGSCSCHLNPPCSYCTTPSEFCPKCEWDALEEQRELIQAELERYRNKPQPVYVCKSDQQLFEELPDDKFGYVRFPSGRTFVCLKGKTGGLSSDEILRKLNLHENPHMPRFKKFYNGVFELTYFCD